MRFFGYFKGLPYERASKMNEEFDDYRKFKNTIPKEKVIAHIETLEAGLTSLPTKDIFTGEQLHAGLVIDGEFRFPLEFIHYYKNYDIGIPYDYEAYLKTILPED